MITKWLKATLASFICASQGSEGVASVPMVSVNGTTYYLINTSSINSSDATITTSSSLVTNNTAAGYHIGTGTTPPTENDYTLEAPITSGISGTASKKYAAKSDFSGWIATVTLLINNTGAEPITITEIGAYNNIRTAATQGTTGVGTNHVYMIDRTLLAVPLTIPAGESGAIEYSIEVSV